MPAPRPAPPTLARPTVAGATDDTQRRIAEIAAALSELAATSEDAFLHVSGQTLDSVDGWRRVLDLRDAA